MNPNDSRLYRFERNSGLRAHDFKPDHLWYQRKLSTEAWVAVFCVVAVVVAFAVCGRPL